MGKDTMTGHWEMIAQYHQAFKTYTDTGFPKELLDELSRRTGHKIVGNKSASGTGRFWMSWGSTRSPRGYDRLHFRGLGASDLRK